MDLHQKALLVTARPDETHGLDELNVLLSRGWRVVTATAMGGAGVSAQNGLPDLCFAALVVVERRDDTATVDAAAAVQDVDDLIDELTEGDGSDVVLEEQGLTESRR